MKNLFNVKDQRKILSRLLTIADNTQQFMEEMHKVGWNTVFPRIHFEQSFSQGQDDLMEYHQYLIELAKAYIANPNIRFRLPEGEPYDSSFLALLRERRDRELAEQFPPAAAPAWATKLTSCIRRMELLRYSQPEEFNRRFNLVLIEEHEIRKSEIAQHKSSAFRNYPNDIERPSGFYKNIVERYFSSMNFNFDTRRSKQSYIVFSKPLVDEIDLCLTPEPLVWWPGKREGKISIVLTMQSVHHHRSLKDADWGQVLIIEYAKIIPYFDYCYNKFVSFDELEIIVKSRAFLLSLIIKEIEERLRYVFCL